jgi:hypothetical protein
MARPAARAPQCASEAGSPARLQSPTRRLRKRVRLFTFIHVWTDSHNRKFFNVSEAQMSKPSHVSFLPLTHSCSLYSSCLPSHATLLPGQTGDLDPASNTELVDIPVPAAPRKPLTTAQTTRAVKAALSSIERKQICYTFPYSPNLLYSHKSLFGDCT